MTLICVVLTSLSPTLLTFCSAFAILKGNSMFNHFFKTQYTSIPIATYSETFRFDSAAETQVVTGFHYHDEFELILVTKGHVNYTINNKHFYAQKNDLIIINPYDFHYADADTNQEVFSYICLDFDLSKMPNFEKFPIFTAIADGHIRFQNHLQAGEEHTKITDTVKEIYDLFEQKSPHWELSITGALMLLFYYLLNVPNLEADNVTQKNLKSTIFAKTVLSFINDNYTNKITSEDAANHMSFEKSYFCRLFKKTFRHSFSNYLNFFRVSRARTLLTEGETNITKLAAVVGFDELTYFSAVFKKHFGKPPSEYRTKT